MIAKRVTSLFNQGNVSLAALHRSLLRSARVRESVYQVTEFVCRQMNTFKIKLI